MKKLKNLGKTLSTAEQKTIKGGCPRCGHDPILIGGDTGGGTGGSDDTCGFALLCSPGKCFNPRTCRCQYGEGAGPNNNGTCLY